MDYLQELSNQIEQLKEEMESKMVEKKFNSLDSEILEISQLLDFLILKKITLEELEEAC